MFDVLTIVNSISGWNHQANETASYLVTVLLDLSSCLPSPTVHSVVVSTGYLRVSHFNLEIFPYYVSYFQPFVLQIWPCPIWIPYCMCPEAIEISLLSAFPEQEQHPCSYLKLLAQAFRSSLVRKLILVTTLGKRLFRPIHRKKHYILMLITVLFKITFPLPAPFPTSCLRLETIISLEHLNCSTSGNVKITLTRLCVFLSYCSKALLFTMCCKSIWQSVTVC